MFPPVGSTGVEDKSPAQKNRDDQTMECERAHEIAAEVVTAGSALTSELDGGDYETLLTFGLAA